MKSSILLRAVLIVITLNSFIARAAVDETASDHDRRMEWFRDARFGMFIHWGLYAQAAGEWKGKPMPGSAAEWIQFDMKIPSSEYTNLVTQFNPVKFNARDWVRLAKGAGMKYIVITSKHHDGFGLYRSDLTDWCIKSTRFQRDPLKELARACEAEGVRLCFYYSIMDWHHPDYSPRPGWNDVAQGTPDFDRYVGYMKGQLKELLTGYGKIGILWFDGEWEPSWTHERGVDLYSFIRGLQPDIIVNNRVGKGRAGMAGMNRSGHQSVGDYGTPEQEIPATGFGPGVDWESCMTMNNSWGFMARDQQWKSTRTLVRNLIDCSSKGGNYLLNVGPTAEGLIPDASIERLKAVGKWMAANSEAIYGTDASPFTWVPWGRVTRKVAGNETTLYLHVFDWPSDGRLVVPGLQNKASSANLLRSPGRKLTAANNDMGVVLTGLPNTAPDDISSTIVLKVAGAVPTISPVAYQNNDGSIVLPARVATLHGQTFRYEHDERLDNLGFWTEPGDWAEWQAKISNAGTFDVSIEIAAPAASMVEISAGDQSIRCPTPATGDYVTFHRVKVGSIDLPKTGPVAITVRPVKDGWQPINLKAVNLTPVKR